MEFCGKDVETVRIIYSSKIHACVEESCRVSRIMMCMVNDVDVC